jgi:hypothetical protein
MVDPGFTSRMKQRSYSVRLGIDAREVRSLMKIAVIAGEGQVFWLVSAAMHLGNNMFNVERR